MTYCKYCGMESEDPVRCEWCGRVLPRPARVAPRQPSTNASQPPSQVDDDATGEAPFTFYIYESRRFAPPSDEIVIPIAHKGEEPQELLLDLFIYLGALTFMASFLIAWRYTNPYILAAIGCMFLAGILMARFKAIPAFVEECEEISIPAVLMLAVFFPIPLIYLGYLVYGVITHRAERTVVRLLSPLFAILLILFVVSAVAGPEAVPMRAYGQFRGVELLGFSALLLGWSAGSWYHLSLE